MGCNWCARSVIFPGGKWQRNSREFKDRENLESKLITGIVKKTAQV
jgi:hypothetical protein